MTADERALRWEEVWERRRQRCLELDGLTLLLDRLGEEALLIVDEVRALAGLDDPAAHVAAAVQGLVDRVNALEPPAPILLHGPVCNGLTMLRLAAQELLAARGGLRPPGLPPLRRPAMGLGRRPGARFEWLLVVGDSAELAELARDCSADLPGTPEVRVAATIEAALPYLRADASGIVLTSLTLASEEGVGAHGLRLAAEAHRRRHAVVLVTAAGDYLDYWSRLPEAGLTGHDVVIKTRPDFADQVRRRVRELAEPQPVSISYEEDTGHVVRIGDVEMLHLEAQEALVLRFLDGTWQTPEVIADAISDETDLAPSPGGVPPLVSTLRHKLADALVAAESAAAQGPVIETRRRDGRPAQYRLAPWLRWDEPPEPAGAARALPQVLVVEDDRDWALWVASWLEELRWPVEVAATPDEVRQRMAGGEVPVLVADLALRGPGSEHPDPEVGLRLIEEVAGRRHGVRVVVLSAFGSRDTLRARLFEAGVRTVDVIGKAAGLEECRAVLLASLQRAADEVWRGVRRARELVPAHQVVRTERNRIEVDGRPIARLSVREADVLDVLFERANLPVKAERLELCFPGDAGPRHGDGKNPALNKVQLTVHRLRKKIDRGVGAERVGEAVIRTRHRGAISTYQLHGVLIDQL